MHRGSSVRLGLSVSGMLTLGSPGQSRLPRLDEAVRAQAISILAGPKGFVGCHFRVQALMGELAVDQVRGAAEGVFSLEGGSDLLRHPDGGGVVGMYQ